MNFTFGIITITSEKHSCAWRESLAACFDSIRRLNIPKYEIVVIGGEYADTGRLDHTLHRNKDIVHIPFDDKSLPYDIKEKKKRWGITPGLLSKKKNLITQHAKYENIVYMYDYIMFDKDWYKGFLKFGNNWDVCMNVIQGFLGERFRDWVVFRHPKYPKSKIQNVSYNNNDPTMVKYGLIIGTYFVAKKSLMIKEPLDNDILWGSFKMFKNGEIKHNEGEDVEWTKRILKKGYKYRMNPHSIVRHSRIKFTGDESFFCRNKPEIKNTIYNFK